MCGRYQFTAEEAQDFWNIVGEISAEIERQDRIKSGEIFPTNLVPVLSAEGGREQAVAMTWGFPHFKNSGVIINAKSETVTDKPMFRGSVLSRRCIVPSTGFFDWATRGKQKTKYLFRLPGESMLYMAGCWNTFKEKDGSGEKQRFVILTTAANDSMREDTGELSFFPEERAEPGLIHDRMPVVLRRSEWDAWLGGEWQALLDRREVFLEHTVA